jgi:hypothetical protein
MKVLIAVLMVVMAATAFAAPIAIRTDPGPMNGIWSFSVASEGGKTTSYQAELTVGEDNTVSGALTGEGVKLPIFGSFNADNVRFYATDENTTLQFSGDREPGLIKGKALGTGGVEMGAWTATHK